MLFSFLGHPLDIPLSGEKQSNVLESAIVTRDRASNIEVFHRQQKVGRYILFVSMYLENSAHTFQT